MEITCPATLHHQCDHGLLAMHVCSPVTTLSCPVVSTVINVVAIGHISIEGEPVGDAVRGGNSRTRGRHGVIKKLRVMDEEDL